MVANGRIANHFLGMICGIFFAAAFSGAVFAQDSVRRGQQLWSQKAGCPFCHGWAGDGHGDEHADGAAANIRETILTRDQIQEVIKCGRPGSSMPRFDKFAYTDRRCFGMTAEELGKDVPSEPPAPLQIFEVDAIADYVAAKLKDAGPVTKEECLEFFGGVGAACDKYPPKG